jgi:hypothetical protein
LAALTRKSIVKSLLEGTSGELADDYQKLMEFLLLHATRVIESGEYLVPAAAAIGIDGALTAMAAAPETFPYGYPDDVERMLIQGLRIGVKSGEYRATGIALELREVRREGLPTVPAIKLILESRAGLPANLYQPFRRRWFRKPHYETYFTKVGRAVVFDDSVELS